jgi:DNA replication protein DnaC
MSEENFYEYNFGLKRDDFQKVLPKIGRVLDMNKVLTAFKAKAMTDEERKKRGRAFWESEDEAIERKKAARLKAFRMQFLDNSINDNFLNEYDNDKDEMKRRLRNMNPNTLKQIWSWSIEQPFKISGFRSRGYFLAGQTGLGKTSLMKMHAVKMYDEFPDEIRLRGSCVKFIHLPEFMKRYFSLKEDHDRNIMEYQFATAKLLYIDEVGGEKYSEGKEDILRSLLDRRIDTEPMNKNKYTFFSSNWSIDGLPYDEPTKRRIRDLALEINMGGCLSPKIWNAKSNRTDSQSFLSGNPSYS